MDGVEYPTIPSDFPGMCLVLKPPGWEVDTEGSSNIRHLSGFLQLALSPDKQALAFRPDFGFGFIHRLDIPSSGLILTATNFEGYCFLEWQMYTYAINREYHVVGDGVAKVSKQNVPWRILDTKTAIVADNGRPALSHIRFLADMRGTINNMGTLCHVSVCHVSIRIYTGRRHQIRVHMQACDCSSVADSRYSPGPAIVLTR